MLNTIGLIAIGYIAAMVTVLVFRRPPATPDEAADNKIKDDILAKLKAISKDVESTV